MSFFGLGLAGKSLQAFQDAENVTSDNIANVQTPGASRQVAVLNEAPPIVGSPFYASNSGQVGTFGDGVTLQAIQRIHDDSYDALYRSASSSSNFYSTEQTVLQGVQASFGEPSSGISAAFSDYQASLHALAANPIGSAERSGVLAAANELVGRIAGTGQAIQSQQQSVQQAAGRIVQQANNDITQIAALNQQIRAAKAVGDNPNTYQDQRDHLVDDLSTLLGTQSALQANGSTYVTVGGQALVDDGQAYLLAPPVVGTYPANSTQAGESRLVIGFQNDPSPSNPTPVLLGSGQLQGYVDAYNNKLTPYANQLNAFTNGLAAETARITGSGYDLNGIQGVALFQPIVSSLAISATNVKVGISDPSQFPGGVASTAAGTLVQPLNAANNSVSSAALLTDPSFNNPANGNLTGTLTISIDNTTETFNYDTTQNTGNSSSIGAFVNSFNSQHFGLDASFDPSSQQIVFTRDPANIDLKHRALQGSASATASFKIVDTPAVAAPALPLKAGQTTTSLLQVLGAGQINNVQQDSTNAWGTNNAGAVNALLTAYASPLGVPALQTTTSAAITAGQTITLAETNLNDFSNIQVGATLTLDAVRGASPPPIAPQENVVVTAVARPYIDSAGVQHKGTITFTALNAHAAGASITTAQNNTLGQSYANLVALVGLDTSTAINGASSQQKLTTNIDQVRQGIDGINIDEETQNLIKFQNAYAAAAHTISVINDMLKTAVDLGK